MDSPLPLRERYRQELVVRGLAERTVDAYVRAVAQMVDRTGLHPARMSEADVRAYLVSLVETHGCAESTYRQHATGLCHFFDWVLGRSFAVLDAARPRRRSPLPEVLTLGEVQRILAAIRRPDLHAAAVAVYSCGLRRSEAVDIRTHWIVADGSLLHVHDGKGGADRLVPLPRRTLELLREHWRRARPSGDLLFESSCHAGTPLRHDTLRRALKEAAREAGIARRICLHTLRHSYATHLLERGVPLPLIRRYLGHRQIGTTAVYTHLTGPTEERARAALDEITRDL